ncbi:type II toxin-antitoxin system VapC family toxin [Allomesorhizobium camelthorni]|nr:type II toxin-antitoxin system VapC family toxin [Mesorhizobium camelthorni]
MLDSSVVLAVLFNEKGADNALRYFKDGQCCGVNVAEIVARLIDKGRTPDEAVSDFEALGLDISGFSPESAVLAGRLRLATRHKGLSLGDRACIALAIHENAVAVTADRSWADLDLGCKVELIR